MKDLVLALFQADLYWHDRGANLAMFEEQVWQLKEQVDIMVLPEMFTTGFTMDAASYNEPMNFHTTKWLKQMAAQTQAVLTGSLIIKENGNYYNRLLWVTPDGEVSHYDKRHLFRMAEEDHHYDMGRKNIILECKGWKILPQVCYDLRFPIWSRNQATSTGEMDYDLAFYVASWPASRVNAWDILLKARAVENLCYTVGVNRVGVDGNGVDYCGHSAAYDFKGNTLATAGESVKLLTVKLEGEALLGYREKFPAWKDMDPFELKDFNS